MKKSIIIALTLLVGLGDYSSQDNIPEILATISLNNKSLKANAQYFESKKLEYQTGLSLENPFINYDFMIGSPDGAGNQTDLTVVQAFDFPSSYGKKQEISQQLISQADILIEAERQNILLKSQELCLELIYRIKLDDFLTKRRIDTEDLLTDFEKKMDLGNANILDVNKSKLMLIEINREYQSNKSKIVQLKQGLVEMNGGQDLDFNQSNYTIPVDIPDYDTFYVEVEANDPTRKLLLAEKDMAQNQIALTKSLNLPKMEIGYHYQGILNQTFQGVHLGLSIPLWEQKNKVKMQESRLLFKDLELEDHHNEHYYELQHTYAQYLTLGSILNEYEAAFSKVNNSDLLNSAMEHGQISTIEYFMEMTFYNEAYMSFLETEFEYQMAIAKLLKHRL